MLIVHAGNRIDGPDRVPPRFPAAHAVDVRDRLAVLLDALDVDRVVSAAAAGADLLVLQAAARVGVPTTIALPLEPDDFRRRSVEDLGGPWPAWFDEAIAAADEVVVDDLSHEDEWYLLGNEVILDAAAARSAHPPLVVAVRAGAGSATDDFVDRGVARGWTVVDLDPSIGPDDRPVVPVDAASLDGASVAALIDLDLGWAEVPDAPPLPSEVTARRDQLRRLS
ncbi:MAG: hypothetical protein AAFZ07_19755 [Actinomycetota bacterium]